MTGLCIYHGGCTDGVAAAHAVWKANPGWTFYPGVYQQEPPWELIDEAMEVLLVDFSYKRPVLEEIARRTEYVSIMDHHKSAQQDLDGLDYVNGIAVEFDMNRCGALMAWDHFHSKSCRPALLMDIDAADRFTKDRDPELIMSLRSHPHAPASDHPNAWLSLMNLWSEFMTPSGWQKLKADGKAIHRYYRARVDETKPHAAPMTIGQYRHVPVVNAPFYLASDVAGELARDAPDGIAAVWWRNRDRSVTFSLRSRGEVDVSALAVVFGGGGHPGAAGFRVGSIEGTVGILDEPDEQGRLDL